MGRKRTVDLLKMPPAPECDKAHKVHKESQAQGEFLSWLLNEKGYHLGKWGDDPPDECRVGHPPINQLLAEFHNIDYDEMEHEKRRVLQYIREQQRL